MLERVITNGDTGASRAGWLAARAHGVATRGWLRKGFLTDDGSHPEFAVEYGAAELPTDDEQTCAERNAQDSDGSIWFGRTTTPGAHATAVACLTSGKPYMPVDPCAGFEPWHIARWLVENHIAALNVAGSREHHEPGIGERVERFLCEVLGQLGHARC